MRHFLSRAKGEEMERAEGAARQAFRKLMGLWEAEKRSAAWMVQVSCFKRHEHLEIS